MEHHHAEQKVRYDLRSHGKPFSVGDLVWLHTPAVPQGKSRKLHRPWTGPYRVVAKPSDSVYRLQHVQFRRRRPVVHFNRLKHCSSGTRLPPPCTQTSHRRQTSPHPPIGAGLQLLDDDADSTSHEAPAGNPLPPGQPAVPVSDTTASLSASPPHQSPATPPTLCPTSNHLPTPPPPSPTSFAVPLSTSESPQPPPPRRYPQRQPAAPSRLYGTVQF